MTRETYIELLRDRLKRIDTAGRVRPQLINMALDMVWQNMAFENMGSIGSDVNFCTKLYAATAVTLGADGRYYTTLPNAIINLPRAASGVGRINQVNSRDYDFSPVTEKNFRLLASQDVYSLGNKIYYYVTKDTVFYGDSMTAAIAAVGVDMRLVIPFADYDLDEDVPVPSGQAERFLGDAMNFLMGTTPVNQNNTNKETAP